MIPVEIFNDIVGQYEETHLNAFHIMQSIPMEDGYFQVILSNGKWYKCKGKYILFISRMKAVLKG